MKEKIYSFTWWHLLFIISFLYILLGFLVNYYVLTSTWYYNSLSSQLAQERITELLSTKEKFRWLGYLFVPVVLISKWLILSSVLYIGLFLANERQKFADSLKIIIIAEFALIVASIIKTIILLFNKPETLQELQFFYPLSLAQLVNAEKTPLYLSYALQQVNVFEIFYWLLLMLGVTAFTGKKFSASFKLVAASYGVVFCCWVLFITFIQLQMS